MSETWYMRIEWHHEFRDEPWFISSEVGPDGFETRKVHRFKDGTLEWTDENHEREHTALGQVPVGTVEKIDAQEEFTAKLITKAEFEAAWTEAREVVGVGVSNQGIDTIEELPLLGGVFHALVSEFGPDAHVSKVTEKCPHDLQRIRGIGPVGVRNLRRALDEYGLQLAECDHKSAKEARA